MRQYPMFIPPSPLGSKSPKDWSQDEAKKYKDWLLSSIDERITNLEQAFDERPTMDPRDHVSALGKKVAKALLDAPFSEASATGRKLTNVGYALAADMGLLVARYILHRYPNSIRWERVRKPKSDLSYNLPVLEGFKNGNYLDPIAGSTAEAAAVLRGQRGPEAWVRILEFWSGKAA